MTKHQKKELKVGRPRVLKDKECKKCSRLFRPSLSISKYCSYECAVKDRKKKGVYVQCSTCGKSQYRQKSHTVKKGLLSRGYFCSRSCLKGSDFGGKQELVCKICNNKYKTYKSHIRHRGSSFCSMKCTRMYKRSLIKSKDKSAYKKKLWMVFSRYIRLRDNGVCISCGKKGSISIMDAGHYVPKSAGLSLYFDEKNVNCQCTYCNRYMHGNLSRYAVALRQKYGETILEELEWKRNQTTKITEADYIRLIKVYKDKLDEIYGRERVM